MYVPGAGTELVDLAVETGGWRGEADVEAVEALAVFVG